MGNGEVLGPGEFQCISAGTGIEHSEFNPSKSAPVHFYQIWLIPNELGLTPTYQQKRFPDEQLADQLRLVASPEGKDGSLVIHSDANVYLSKLTHGKTVDIPMHADRHMWLQVLQGSVDLGGHPMVTSDAAAVSNETKLSCRATSDSEIMLFDLA
jgi:redox-sensitive bicupin YhaK (pirin superfamily)